MELKELKQEIAKAKASFDLPFEHAKGAEEMMMPRPDTFEVLLSSKGRKFLMPVAKSFPFLYRGQEQEFNPKFCWPTLYRNNPDEADIFIERLRMMRFAELIDSHPIVAKFLKRHGLYIDYEGLAQHYGFRTSVLDCTDDVDIALFFAMCPFEGKEYHYHTDEKEHNAILYIIRPSTDYQDFAHADFSDQINPIGMHPFSRPRRQRGFALHISRNETFRPIKVDFTFTCTDSRNYFDKFNGGTSVFPNDEFSAKAPLISKLTEFSFELYDKTFTKFRPKGYSKTKLMKELISKKSITFKKEVESIVFTEKECRDIIDKWNGGEYKDVQQRITRKTWLDGKVGDRYANYHEYRTQSMIFEEEIIRLIGSASEDATYCPGLYVRYNESETQKPRKDFSSSKKIEAKAHDIVARPFLTEKDMLIG